MRTDYFANILKNKGDKGDKGDKYGKSNKNNGLKCHAPVTQLGDNRVTRVTTGRPATAQSENVTHVTQMGDSRVTTTELKNASDDNDLRKVSPMSPMSHQKIGDSATQQGHTAEQPALSPDADALLDLLDHYLGWELPILLARQLRWTETDATDRVTRAAKELEKAGLAEISVRGSVKPVRNWERN